MTLKEHIDDIRDNLKIGLYTNEAAVSQSIVLRLLDVLSWPRFNPQVIIPEYSVEGRRVDFALCHPPSKPIIFIEVKQVGNIEGAERQLFEYAFHEGVPIAILTDGREWRFFHPTAQGDYRERKVHEMDLTEDDSEKNAERLNRYLNYESIRTGEAAKAIEEDYRNVSRQRQVVARLPEAWDKLVEEADESLLDIVAKKVESLCQYRPTDEQVLSFLKSLKKETKLDLRETPPLPTPSSSISNPRSKTQSKASAKFIVVTMNGEVIKEHTGIGTFVKVIEKLIGKYGEEKVLRAAEGHPIISTSSFNYPGKPDKRLGRLYISTNHSTELKEKYLDHIANRFRDDLKVEVNLKVEIVDK